ncbi:MAG: cell envelope biogenesis protein TolA [Pseudomonadota bacterium]
MRTAFIVSAVLHLSILSAVLVSLPDADPFAPSAVVALPVELVTIEEETDLTIGNPTETEVLEEAAPETVEVETPPEPEATPGATDTPSEEIATSETAREAAPESTSPEPAAEPEPVAETPQETDPAPEPVEETEVAALDPQETPPQPSEDAAEPVKVPETVVPRSRPTPPPRRERARQEQASNDAFDADRLSALINRTDGAGGGAGSAQASLGAATGRASAALTLSEMDALRSQMQRCWNPPIGLAGGETIVVAVQIRLAPDGSVETVNDVGGGAGSLYVIAADAARRAVIQCQPYRLPPTKYDSWKDVLVNFDPRELF